MKPTTTGETANGRSTSAFRSAFPGMLERTIMSAKTIPKTVFRGTAISATLSVSSRAATASGWVIAFHTGPMP